jgi:hypothetical protein
VRDLIMLLQYKEKHRSVSSIFCRTGLLCLWIYFISMEHCHVMGWTICNGTGAVCPDGNLCCGSHLCLSGTDDTASDSVCCSDDSSTGCGENFICSLDNSSMCTALDPEWDQVPAHLPRHKLCSVTPAMTHTYAIPFPMSNQGSMDKKVPVATYLSTLGPIHEENTVFADVQRIIILIHGSRRNVDDYVCCTSAAIPEATAGFHSSDSVLIIAPWFPAAEDGILNVTVTPSQINISSQFDVLRWIGNSPTHIFHTWRYGAGAINDPSISSYDVVDFMLTHYIYDTHKFPSLNSVVVTGHSAGGQFVQRWTLLSNAIRDHDLEIVAGSPAVRTVVANPKSFAYLDARRWMVSTGASSMDLEEMEFRVPTAIEQSQCPSYNEWEWGLDPRESPLLAPYVQNAIEMAGGKDVIVQRYSRREIIYLSGEQDILWNGDCNDQAQGPNRRTRSERFFAALKYVYNATKVQHERWVIPDVHHDHCLMYQSLQGRKALFGIWNSSVAVKRSSSISSTVASVE